MPVEVLIALGLVLIFEGILPLASPGAFRRYLGRVQEMNDNELRVLGAGSMLVGVVVVSFFI